MRRSTWENNAFNYQHNKKFARGLLSSGLSSMAALGIITILHYNEVADKRRRLVPKMKEAHEQGKSDWLSYDTMYVDSRAVRDQGFDGDDVKVLSWNIDGLRGLKKDDPDIIEVFPSQPNMHEHLLWRKCETRTGF